MQPTFDDIDATLYEEEGIFARNEGDQLIRIDPATASDYDKRVKVTIDGHEIEVPRAVPASDAQGNIIRDKEGLTTPRATTIYDAAMTLYGQLGLQNPIPVLCHQEHMSPVAVCRVCVVQIQRWAPKRAKPGEPPTGEKELRRERKLLPACQHRVEDGMIVDTLGSPNPKERERLRASVGLLTELLMSDHVTRPEQKRQPYNELVQLGTRLAIKTPRFESSNVPRGQDDSSRLIAINHDSCILCNRCVRACDEVKENLVIGRSGKGFKTTISFDLNEKMGSSSCVSCGECMVSCPTDALTFRRPVVSTKSMMDMEMISEDAEPVRVDELRNMHPLFAGLPYKFLQWNAHSVVRRRLAPGEVLCREGEYGATAFILLKGRYGISISTSIGEVKSARARGILGWFGKVRSIFREDRSEPTVISADGQAAVSLDEINLDEVRPTRPIPLGPDGKPFLAIRDEKDLILGEMACLNNYPRSATIVSIDEGEVLEVRRNVLYVLQRTKASRDVLNRVYRDRVLGSHLQTVEFFRKLPPREQQECIDFLRDRIQLLRLEPGQMIFRQGENADSFFLIRLGFVRVARTVHGKDRVLDYLGPGKNFGEIALVSRWSAALTGSLPRGTAPGTRTATCSALDHVELVRISDRDFKTLFDRYPALREHFEQVAKKTLAENKQKLEDPVSGGGQFIELGLFNAKNLLVLDLQKCTRCDECTKACADIHDDGVSRLLREGMRFDKFLVATSCRSCQDPYCMVGCPVDAIHRREGRINITIEKHCIGCGLCASNCPYGNIQMIPNPLAAKKENVPKLRAATCDLCEPIIGTGTPNCVYSCPHDAAFRMSGNELQQLTLVKRDDQG